MPQLLLYLRRLLPSVNDSDDSIVLLLLLLFFVPREFISHQAIFELISQHGFDASEFSLDVGACAALTTVFDASGTVAMVLRLRFVVAFSRYARIFFVGVMTFRRPDFRRRVAFVTDFVADTFCNGDAFSNASSLAFGIRTSSIQVAFNFLSDTIVDAVCLRRPRAGAAFVNFVSSTAAVLLLLLLKSMSFISIDCRFRHTSIIALL